MTNWSSQSRKKEKNGDDSDIYCLDKANTEVKNEVLKDLLWTLYSKLEAVLRGHRFVESCIRRIKKVLFFFKSLNHELLLNNSTKLESNYSESFERK